MAKITLNSALKGIRGMIDNWVYKRFGDGVVLSRPSVNEGPPTEAQLAQREQFRKAAEYAQTALADPTLRVLYGRLAKERGKTTPPIAIALGDYFTAPVVTEIDVEAYHGQVGDKILVSATDKVEVAAVTVTIRDTADSSVLEQGAAMLVEKKWVYTATVAVPPGHAVSIEAKAVDHPGNERTLTQAYP